MQPYELVLISKKVEYLYF